MSKIDKNMPKVLLYDLEVTPVRAYIWRTGKQHISHEQIKEGDFPRIICVAYKWEHEKTVKIMTWDNKKQDCSKLVDEFAKLIEEADIVIGHNAASFDNKHINTHRFLAGQPPIAWPTTEDTLKQIRQQFALPSFRLDYIAKLLFGEGKSPMSFQDWIDILENRSEKAFLKMQRYCKRDVKIMSDAYEKLKPYLKAKANRALITGGNKLQCPRCGNEAAPSRGIVTLASGRYRNRRCRKCKHTFRAERI